VSFTRQETYNRTISKNLEEEERNDSPIAKSYAPSPSSPKLLNCGHPNPNRLFFKNYEVIYTGPTCLLSCQLRELQSKGPFSTPRQSGIDGT